MPNSPVRVVEQRLQDTVVPPRQGCVGRLPAKFFLERLLDRGVIPFDVLEHPDRIRAVRRSVRSLVDVQAAGPRDRELTALVDQIEVGLALVQPEQGFVGEWDVLQPFGEDVGTTAGLPPHLTRGDATEDERDSLLRAVRSRIASMP